ncbi:MAG: hypothetical protein JWQ44_925 [Chthoniobacter sp.]|nr:hypothetical protein [Chthoniobacter sp.]
MKRVRVKNAAVAAVVLAAVAGDTGAAAVVAGMVVVAAERAGEAVAMAVVAVEVQVVAEAEVGNAEVEVAESAATKAERFQMKRGSGNWAALFFAPEAFPAMGATLGSLVLPLSTG